MTFEDFFIKLSMGVLYHAHTICSEGIHYIVYITADTGGKIRPPTPQKTLRHAILRAPIYNDREPSVTFPWYIGKIYVNCAVFFK